MWSFIRDTIFDWVTDNDQILLVDIILTGLLAYPLYSHVRFGWARKASEIENCLTAWAKQVYLSLFQKEEVHLSDADKRFAALYRNWYGRRRLITPIVLVLVVALFENFLLAADLVRISSSDAKLQVASSAIAGAYTFVTWDFFARVQKRNILIADIMRGALRLAVAVPIGYAFAALLTPDLGIFIAFAVGVFPLSTVSLALRQLANKRLGLEMGPAQVGSQVGQLSGVDASIADRIEDADITTIPQLAWCDPIQLTMRTNLSFEFVVDLCSQALAWVYLNGKLDALRPLGLRGAFEIRVLQLEAIDSANADDHQKALNVMPLAAAAAQIPQEGLTYAFAQIAEDPITIFLYEASGESPSTFSKEAKSTSL